RLASSALSAVLLPPPPLPPSFPYTTLFRSPGREVALFDGTRANAGDTVITRRNDRTLRAGDGSFVKNGDRWHVLTVHPDGAVLVDRKSTRLNSSHVKISYAVFCLKKKTTTG